MSLALYRKYRPGTFAELVGQEHVTGPLQQALTSGRIHHAYLFSGPRGCGKTSSARILARSLNCEQGPTPTPCGECQSCIDLAPSGPGSIDVIEIDAASHGGVDDARDLRERAFFAPVASRYKIYIVDEAHMVSREGFNALLKLVEEPPPHLKFVFATTEPEKVIGTIRSRTHHYPFRLMTPGALRDLLTTICAAEQVTIEPAALALVVRAGAGSARDSLSVLDQLIAGAGPEGVTYAGAVALLGYTDASLLDEVIDAFSAHDGAAVFEALDRVIESGHDPRRFTADLLERLRDLIVLTAVPDAGDKGLLDVPGDTLERMRAQATRMGAAELSRAADVVNAGLTEMRGATAPRLLLELICARVLLPGAASDASAALARLDRLERRMDIGAGPAPAAAPAAPAPAPARRAASPAPAAAAPTPAAPAPPTPLRAAEASAPAAQPAAASPAPPASPAPTAEPAGAGGLDAAAVRRMWDQILEAVKPRKRTTYALLSQHAQVVEVRGNVLLLAFGTAPIARQFELGVNSDVLREALKEFLGVNWQIETTVAGSSGSPAPARPSAPVAQAPAPSAPAPAVEEFHAHPDDETVDPGVGGIELLQRQLGATVLHELSSE